MKPIIKYSGGKRREIPHLVRNMPYFTGRYVEPFFGDGALFFHLEPHEAIINDINTPLMLFYRGIRDDFDQVRHELGVLADIYNTNQNMFNSLNKNYPKEHIKTANEALYYSIRDMFNGKIKKEYSDAAIYYFINKTAYSGMIRYNSKGMFNVPFGRYKRLSIDNVSRLRSQLLQRATLYNRDYVDIFNLCHPDDFVFLDPPYDCVFSNYGNEEYKGGFDEQSHRRLANEFYKLPCKAMMVINRTKLTEELYSADIVDEYAKNYAVNIRNRFKSSAHHIIITNYHKP